MGGNCTAPRHETGSGPGAGPVLAPTTKGLKTRAERNPSPRRGLSRVEAADYVGVSPTLFDRAVREGKMPKPFPLYGRVLWDIRKLDLAFTALDTEDATNDPWAGMTL
jgi:hypothetical protein